MAITPVSDSTTTALTLALRGLATRQRVSAKNMANLETPGYIAGRVTFEDSLRDAMAGGAPTSATVAQTDSVEPTGPNGNNVLADQETMVLTETGMRYQLLTEAVSMRFGVLRTAIGRA
jgi:flagellar basal-body rod protein FlgB